MPSDTRLLHPAWYGLPVVLFLCLAYGDPLLLAKIPAIEDLSTWLLKKDRLWDGRQSAPSSARALSLLLMPLQLLGTFWVLWPMRSGT